MTLRPRSGPVADEEVTPEAIARLDAHLLEFARGFRRWMLGFWLGYPVTILVTFGMLILLATLDAQGAAWFLAVVPVIVFTSVWLGWYVSFVARSMKDSSYSFADRLATSMKRGSLGPSAHQALMRLPADSALRAYYGRLMDSSTQPSLDSRST